MIKLIKMEALPDSTISTPTIIDSFVQDSEGEEIFFGNVSEKERMRTTMKRYVLIIFIYLYKNPKCEV